MLKNNRKHLLPGIVSVATTVYSRNVLKVRTCYVRKNKKLKKWRSLQSSTLSPALVLLRLFIKKSTNWNLFGGWEITCRGDGGEQFNSFFKILTDNLAKFYVKILIISVATIAY